MRMLSRQLRSDRKNGINTFTIARCAGKGEDR